MVILKQQYNACKWHQTKRVCYNKYTYRRLFYNQNAMFENDTQSTFSKRLFFNSNCIISS